MQQLSNVPKLAGAQGGPVTKSQLQAFYSQRGELQEQLKSLTRRRNELQEQRSGMSSSRGADHDARIREIDARTSQIDRDILRLDVQIANAQAQPFLPEPTADALLAGARQPSTEALVDQAIRDAMRGAARDTSRQTAGMVAMALVAGVVLWRGFLRFFKPARPVSIADDRRFEQLQQSIDVIALEVERMSESQRYVAKVLSEKYPALAAGAAQPVSVKSKEPASANRG